jgi:2-dehydropantoate 2-reductase
MKFAVIGGVGAMGGLFGGRLAAQGIDVTLIDVWQQAVDLVNKEGLRITEKSGEETRISVKATTDPSNVGVADVVIVFVKCYHTEAAVRAALPLLGPDSAVLSLQNGWGNADTIGGIVGNEQVLAGVTYNSATVLGPGHIQQAGIGTTIMGELDGRDSDRLRQIAATFRQAGLEVQTTDAILLEIWSKLALNICTLPTSALLRFYAGELIQHEGTLAMMRALLQETVAVAQAKGISLDEEERWNFITGLLERATGAKASMLQDVENRRQTEIDVINGAVVRCGQEVGIPTPFNDAMVWMVRALEETFTAEAG